MKAAVVTSFDVPPQYADFPAPAPSGADEIVVDVLAAGLHPRVRSQADGSHYTSTEELPLVPGIDGVGRGPGGELRYFILPHTALGAMAEQTIVDARRSVVLPEGTDAVAVAAAMNPAMSAWIALRRRIDIRPGQKVLVLGATGNAGRLAIEVARLLGADEIVAVGRDAGKLSALGIADTVTLTAADAAERLADVGRTVDIVLDYLWGQPAADVLAAIVPHRKDDTQQLSWVQIGSVAGPAAPIPSAALRATRLQIVGSGQGSVTTHDILSELPALAAEISNGTFGVEARPVPLHDVAQAWADAGTTRQRIVLTPHA